MGADREYLVPLACIERVLPIGCFFNNNQTQRRKMHVLSCPHIRGTAINEYSSKIAHTLYLHQYRNPTTNATSLLIYAVNDPVLKFRVHAPCRCYPISTARPNAVRGHPNSPCEAPTKTAQPISHSTDSHCTVAERHHHHERDQTTRHAPADKVLDLEIPLACGVLFHNGSCRKTFG